MQLSLSDSMKSPARGYLAGLFAHIKSGIPFGAWNALLNGLELLLNGGLWFLVQEADHNNGN